MIPSLHDLVKDHFETPSKKWWQFWRKQKTSYHTWRCLHTGLWVICKNGGDDYGCVGSHTCWLNERLEMKPDNYFGLINNEDGSVTMHDNVKLMAADPDFFTKLDGYCNPLSS